MKWWQVPLFLLILYALHIVYFDRYILWYSYILGIAVLTVDYTLRSGKDAERR